MKYIRFQNRGFVLFEEAQSHAEIAKMLGDEVVSAGYVRAVDFVADGQVVCSGESDSLKCSAQKGDTPALRQRLSPV
jgi:hypothetical protein